MLAAIFLFFPSFPMAVWSWSYPFYIDSRGPDDRDPAVGVTAQGTLLCAFHRSSCYKNGIYNGNLHRFDIVLSRSDDEGETWSSAQPIASITEQSGGVFGRIAVTPNGDLLMRCYTYPSARPVETEAGFLQSQDDGQSWCHKEKFVLWLIV